MSKTDDLLRNIAVACLRKANRSPNLARDELILPRGNIRPTIYSDEYRDSAWPDDGSSRRYVPGYRADRERSRCGEESRPWLAGLRIKSLSWRLRPDAEKFAAPVRSNRLSIW